MLYLQDQCYGYKTDKTVRDNYHIHILLQYHMIYSFMCTHLSIPREVNYMFYVTFKTIASYISMKCIIFLAFYQFVEKHFSYYIICDDFLFSMNLS